LGAAGAAALAQAAQLLMQVGAVIESLGGMVPVF